MKDRLKPGGMSVSFCEHEVRSSRNSKPTIFCFFVAYCFLSRQLVGVLCPVVKTQRRQVPCEDGDARIVCLLSVTLLVSANQMRHHCVGQKQASYP